MSMTKRIQIPIDEPELAVVKAAATRAGLPVAEWARGILGEEARRQLGETRGDRRRALDALFAADAPVDDVETMIAQSLTGRFG